MKPTAFLLATALATPLLAEPPTPVALAQRVTTLEKQVAELQQQLAHNNHAGTTNATPSAPAQSREIVINFSEHGKIIVEGKELTEEALQAELKASVSKTPNVSVIIRHNPSTPHPSIVRVLNRCSELGISNVAFATRPPTEAHAEATAHAHAESPQPTPPVVIALSKGGTATINNKELSDEALQAELQSLASKTPDQVVVIKCHPASKNEHLAHKLTLCQKANLWKVSIATPPGTAAHAE